MPQYNKIKRPASFLLPQRWDTLSSVPLTACPIGHSNLAGLASVFAAVPPSSSSVAFPGLSHD